MILTSTPLDRRRRALVAVLVVVSLALLAPLPDWAGAGARLAAQEHAEPGESAEGEAEAHHDGWASTIAKATNFLVLAGILVYFLKAPIVGYLRNRDETIRRGLTDAVELRAGAEQQLADVRGRLAGLPDELDGLRRRGRQELAGERARMAAASAREKQHVLDRTRREIDLQFRVARRRLLAHAAELSIARARTRIARHITPEDQRRLIERYTSEVRS